MDKYIDFENYILGESKDFTSDLFDVEYCVNKLIYLPTFRPFLVDKAVSICANYCSNRDFRKKLLKKSNLCPVLIYRLYKNGILLFNEIEPYLIDDCSILCFYFWKEIKNFKSFILNKGRHKHVDKSLLENENALSLHIEYGFHPSSAEFCLKYDDIDNFRDLNISEYGDAVWSPFEWSCKPKYLDFLAFSGFFGSINCFKHLLLNGYQIDDEVISMVVCSGSLDLFRLCNGENGNGNEDIFNASIFCHLSFVKFFVENGTDVNTKNVKVENHCL